MILPVYIERTLVFYGIVPFVSTYSDFQYEIYLAEDRCDLPFSATELEEQARVAPVSPGIQLRG